MEELYELTSTQTIIIAILVVFVVIIIKFFNRLISLKNKVKQSRSSIDIYLTQRFDLIPNLVEVVKNYKEYEKETMLKITSLRNTYLENKSIDVGNKLNNNLNQIIGKLENYPDLKANEQFNKLQNTLQKMESQLQASRRIYNGDVTLYNTEIQKFPNNIIARILGFKEENLFEAEENKKKNIDVNI